MNFTPFRNIVIAAWGILGLGLPLYAGTVKSDDGLAAATPATRTDILQRLSLDGRVLEGVSTSIELRKPQTSDALGPGFRIDAHWRGGADRLELRGTVFAAGNQDCAADLVVRVAGASLPLGSMDTHPLLLPRPLVGKLPVVSLRVNGSDCLALAVPPDVSALYSMRETRGGVELVFPLGFTRDGPESLRMKALFGCILYRTDPAWHFRAALDRYYRLYPEPFRPFIRKAGGWFFAAATQDLPNPQHFHYHEGGPETVDADIARGLGTYPYRESSSLTLHLPGARLPRDYDEAMTRLRELGAAKVPTGWTPTGNGAIDARVFHSGAHALRVEVAKPGQWSGATQSVRFEKPVHEPFEIRGWSRARNVAGTVDHDYSIYVDVCYADGSYLFGQCASFPTGTHEWSETTVRVTPSKPVIELRVYCLLRGTHTGTAWFDDLRIGPVTRPDANWLKNPGFEKIGARQDLTFLRDNVCTQVHGAEDRWVMRITDNLSSDVAPVHPLNLLRFTLNVDPDLPERPGHPTVAATEFRRFDDMLRQYPDIEGFYIDSVSAWCYRVRNTRRDQWIANNADFSYDPATRRVVALGRFGMCDYLAALQKRYHPAGKAIFTNIHCSHDAFPLYRVSDVPGIESSRYRSENDLFFYRACSYRKPLLLMDFINLQGLDKRELAEAFHLNAAFWGEIPSTGRFVKRAYREYGDVTHAYMPAIQELARAGWNAVPLCYGARAERFGDVEAGAVYFTARLKPGDPAQLKIDAAAMKGLGNDLAAMDAVWLDERPVKRGGGGWELDLGGALPDLAVTRISPRRGVAPWLLRRATEHVRAAGRVQGRTSMTPAIAATLEVLDRCPRGRPSTADLERCRAALSRAIATVPRIAGDLFVLSQRRELLQARLAIEKLAMFRAGLSIGFEGPRTIRAGTAVDLTPCVIGSGGKVTVSPILWKKSRQVTPNWAPALPAEKTRVPETPAPGTWTARVVAQVALPDMTPFAVESTATLRVLPGADLRLEAGRVLENGKRILTLVLSDVGVPRDFLLETSVTPPLPGVPDLINVPAGTKRMRIALPVREDGLEHTAALSLRTPGGAEIAVLHNTFLDEPGPAKNVCPVAECRTDSSYSGYSPGPLTDGVTATEGVDWAKQAWASADNSEPHWIELRFTQPTRVSGVLIFWNREDGRYYAARRCRIVLLTPGGGKRRVAEIDDSRPRSFDRREWPAVPATGLRIEQPSRRGAKQRPGIMWVREVQAIRPLALPQAR